MKVFNDSVTQNPFQYQPIPEPTIRSFKKDSVSVIISKPIPLTLLEIAQDPAMGTAYFCFPAFELYDRNSDEGVESSDEGAAARHSEVPEEDNLLARLINLRKPLYEPLAQAEEDSLEQSHFDRLSYRTSKESEESIHSEDLPILPYKSPANRPAFLVPPSIPPKSPGHRPAKQSNESKTNASDQPLEEEFKQGLPQGQVAEKPDSEEEGRASSQKDDDTASKNVDKKKKRFKIAFPSFKRNASKRQIEETKDGKARNVMTVDEAEGGHWEGLIGVANKYCYNLLLEFARNSLKEKDETLVAVVYGLYAGEVIVACPESALRDLVQYKPKIITVKFSKGKQVVKYMTRMANQGTTHATGLTTMGLTAATVALALV